MKDYKSEGIKVVGMNVSLDELPNKGVVERQVLDFKTYESSGPVRNSSEDGEGDARPLPLAMA